MILYNTNVGLAAGVGFALRFGMTAFIRITPGVTISVMWPYKTVLLSATSPNRPPKTPVE